MLDSIVRIHTDDQMQDQSVPHKLKKISPTQLEINMINVNIIYSEITA